MKKTILIVFAFSAFLIIFATRFPAENVKPTNTPHDIIPVQEFADSKFTDYIISLGATDFEITSASYASRGGITQFVCLFEAYVSYAEGSEASLAHGYYITINNKGEFEINQEGADVNHEMLSQTQ